MPVKPPPLPKRLPPPVRRGPPPLPPGRGGPPPVPLPGLGGPSLPGLGLPPEIPDDYNFSRSGMDELPGRFSPAASDRTVGNADEFGLEPNAQVDVWYDVLSTWLHSVRFSWRPQSGPPTVPTRDPKQREGYLFVRFLDMAVIQYTNPIPYAAFDDLINSSSKGMYLHHASTHLVNAPYITISGPRRRVTSTMRKNRDPKHGNLRFKFAHMNKPKPVRPGR